MIPHILASLPILSISTSLRGAKRNMLIAKQVLPLNITIHEMHNLIIVQIVKKKIILSKIINPMDKLGLTFKRIVLKF